MSIILPTTEQMSTLPIETESKQALIWLLQVLHEHPQNRMMIFAWIFCLHQVGLSSEGIGQQLNCTGRNIRYIVAEVNQSQIGEGKTGRPARETQPENESEEIITIGVTRYAGLWLLLPFIQISNMLPYCHWLSCNGAVIGTPVQLVLRLFAAFICGQFRCWYMNDMADRGFALFTGRWTPLRASQLYTWLGCISSGGVDLFYQGTKVEEWRLVNHYPAILSNDEHVVGHQGGPKMPKGRVPKKGRSMRAHHLFMTFHLLARRFMGLCVTTTKSKLSHVATPNLREMWQARQLAGGDDDQPPIWAIFDRGSYSQTAHNGLMTMQDEGAANYLAHMRRTSKNVAQWDRGLLWGEYELEEYVRGNEWDYLPAERHNLCLAYTRTEVTGVTLPVPTILVIDRDKVDDPDPKAKYAAAFAATADTPAWVQADLYSWRQDHELAFRDCIHALGLDVKPKGYDKDKPNLPLDHPEQTTTLTSHRIHLLTWIKSLAFNRMRDLLDHLPEPAAGWTVLTAIRKLIHRTGLLQLRGDCLWVIFDPFPGDDILTPYCDWVNASDFVIPWLNNLKLRLTVADRPAASVLSNADARKLLFDP